MGIVGKKRRELNNDANLTQNDQGYTGLHGVNITHWKSGLFRPKPRSKKWLNKPTTYQLHLMSFIVVWTKILELNKYEGSLALTCLKVASIKSDRITPYLQQLHLFVDTATLRVPIFLHACKRAVFCLNYWMSN